MLDEWIAQTLDIVDAGDVWFVCIKINMVGWYVAMPESGDYQFGNHCVYHVANVATASGADEDAKKQSW